MRQLVHELTHYRISIWDSLKPVPSCSILGLSHRLFSPHQGGFFLSARKIPKLLSGLAFGIYWVATLGHITPPQHGPKVKPFRCWQLPSGKKHADRGAIRLTGGKTGEVCGSWTLFQRFGDVIQSDILNIKINDLRGQGPRGVPAIWLAISR